jgi:hypothetical protein
MKLFDLARGGRRAPARPAHCRPVAEHEGEIVNLKQIFLFVFVACAPLFQGCSGPLVNISNSEQYKGLVGHTFRLQGDCYIYFFDDGSTKLPYISDKRSFSARMTSDSVGRGIDGENIVGTLKKDTEFKLESVLQQKVISDTTSMRYLFIISLEGTGQAQWTKLNAIDLTDIFKSQPKPPMFLPEYVKSVNAVNNDK